jgi:hypothetical protein
MADGTDEDGTYAGRMDEWVAWETVETTAGGVGEFVVYFAYFSFTTLFQFCNHSNGKGRHQISLES